MRFFGGIVSRDRHDEAEEESRKQEKLRRKGGNLASGIPV
jgi:hypothetical protein